MNWLILGVALLIVLAPTVVLRLRRASRTLDTILAEHRERMTNGSANDPIEDAEQSTATTTMTRRRYTARHRLQGRRPKTVRPSTGYATHRRMSA
ncbi:MAG TPA: hypothetical protein VH333_19620 [Pseudonocardiaceae bacterium]|jgi:Sec-independent protein translocase protein TatA|nr:hypothetical protein [Pseudonocardiaceae bacterium]